MWGSARVGPLVSLDKTRLIEFGCFADENRRKRDDGKPETFDFLGFTHISGKTRNGDKKGSDPAT